MSLPHFFKDDSNSMKYEETIDFFMSWTIRCADQKYISETKVHTCSKTILSRLLADKDNIIEHPFFNNIKVWKQSGNIDLWIEFNAGPENKRYALIIENKMYSSIRPNQLQKYKDIVYEYYEGKPVTIKFVLLRPDYEMGVKHEEQSHCDELGYSYLNLEQLKCNLPIKRTGNDLFDEFWYNWYEIKN